MIDYFAPTTLDEALDHLARRPVRVIAGGTDVYPAQGDRPFADPLLDITAIDALSGLTQTSQGWRIGALTRWSAIAEAALPPAFSGLQQAARQVGGIQIQNAGTLGGNLCNASPAADGVPPLLTLDARVELVRAAGKRMLPLADFITGPRQTALAPGELLSAILIDDPGPTAGARFIKLGARSHLVISIAMAAVVLVPDGAGHVAEARVAVGSCSPVAARMTALEATLAGAPWRPEAVVGRVAAEQFAHLSPIDDVRGSASYRREAAMELTRRALVATLTEATS